MKASQYVCLLLLLLVAALPLPSCAQTAPDAALLAEIANIKAVDHHAHPLTVSMEKEEDTEWDSLNVQGEENAEGKYAGPEMALIPFRLRPGSPDLWAAWNALYGYTRKELTKEGVQELIETKQRVMREQGDNYPAWVLDKLGIETMFANRLSMGRGLPKSRFKWVSYVDALMFPLDNERLRKGSPDLNNFFPSLDRVLKRFVAEQKLAGLPPTLDGYLAKVVTPTLELQKREGVVAVKFIAGYLRQLDFAQVPEKHAKRVYANYVKGGQPSAEEYKELQDYLFHFIAQEAGRLGLAVHIHTGFGIGHYYSVSGSNPLLLEPVFNDPSLRKTTFVLIHGGWPFARQSAAMLLKPNVYVDFSAIAFLIYPAELADVIRSWLEIEPQKVMFGTDAFDMGLKFLGWEEFGWIASNSSRQALARALTGMMNDGEITRDEAVKLARMVLRENAVKLYKLDSQ